MLWVIIVTALLIVSVFTFKWADKNYYNGAAEWLALVSMIVAVISAIALIIMILAIGSNYIGAENNIAALNEQYDFLVYQVELGEYGELDDISQYNLLQDIYEWNKDVRYYKRWNTNPWTNWLIADYLTEYEVIDYSGIYK